MVARIPNLELLLYKAQQALAHDPDFVQKIAEIKENDSRKKVYLDFSVECFSQIWGSTCTGFDVTEAGGSRKTCWRRDSSPLRQALSITVIMRVVCSTTATW